MSDVISIMSIRPDSIVNDVTIIVQPNPAQPTPTEQTTTDTPSQENYGVQSIQITDSLLATDADAELLADYLLRPDPNFWFTGLSLNLHRLTSDQRNTVAQIDIGTFVSVIKTQAYGTPSRVVKNLYVEGIDHRLTPSGHHIDLHFSPVGFSQEWQEVTATLEWQDVASGLSWANLIWTVL